MNLLRSYINTNFDHETLRDSNSSNMLLIPLDPPER